jgi:predicted metal-dependent hydrolase
MQVETALFFESLEQIYTRVFRTIKPRTPVPAITVRFRKYANLTSRIKLADDHLVADISDLLESAPAPIHEALACILIAKLFRKTPESNVIARYQRYLNRAEVRRAIHTAKRERGRKLLRGPQGVVYDLQAIFEELNFRYFNGLMSPPQLGWSTRPSRTTLGHYDPSHHAIVLSSLMDSDQCPKLVVQFVMFHEMLHLRFPTEHKGVRRCVHTKEFKMAEREFERYSEAQKSLRAFVDGAWSRPV